MIAADSSVLIDVIAGSDDASAASAEAVRQALRVGPVVLSEVALAEICTAFQLSLIHI